MAFQKIFCGFKQHNNKVSAGCFCTCSDSADCNGFSNPSLMNIVNSVKRVLLLFAAGANREEKNLALLKKLTSQVKGIVAVSETMSLQT